MSRSNQTSASGAAGGHHHGARQQQQPKRKLVEIAQVARGRTPLKYEFEVIPFFAGACGLTWPAKQSSGWRVCAAVLLVVNASTLTATAAADAADAPVALPC